METCIEATGSAEITSEEDVKAYFEALGGILGVAGGQVKPAEPNEQWFYFWPSLDPSVPYSSENATSQKWYWNTTDQGFGWVDFYRVFQAQDGPEWLEALRFYSGDRLKAA